MSKSDKTDAKQKKDHAGLFKKGQSGNPSGRPKGSRNKATLAMQALFEGEAEEIGRTAIELAKAGDTTAIRLVMERIIPACKDTPLTLDLPKLETMQDALDMQSLIISAVASGEITPSEGKALTELVEGYRKNLETYELEQRIAQLEQQS